MKQEMTKYLKVQSPSPEWFQTAIADVGESRFVDVQDCDVHYLYWPSKREAQGNLLLVHGGGGHAHWWSFLAPMLAQNLNVAALCLSGMGDSGWRSFYDSDIRVEDMRGVISHAQFHGPTYVLGHSFGGYMTSRFGQLYGDEVMGIIIADSPIRPPHKRNEDRKRRPRMGNKRYYSDFEEALKRFRLMPSQPCENEFLVEHIGRTSLKLDSKGWCWKWDGGAMENSRFVEPFHEYLAAATCKKAYLYGEKSKLVDEESLLFIKTLIGDDAPIIGIPEAHHHLMLDQPIAFVTTLRAVLSLWQGSVTRQK